MITATEARSGKSHSDENFPVASRLIQPRYRGPILAFYRFVRAADDVADHPALTPQQKLGLLDALEAALTGHGPPDPEAEPLRHALADHRLSAKHALDLLDAFRLDARKSRYADVGELMGYCALSAMPVGRFVLDVHGERADRTWAASDAICAALQIVNHLQDCGRDFRQLDRVYLPLDVLGTHGATVEDLAAPQASPGLRAVILELARYSERLLNDGAALPELIADTRLAMEIAGIRALSLTIVEGLKRRDPLSEKVHLGKAAFISTGLLAAGRVLAARMLYGALRLPAQFGKREEPGR